MPDFGDLIHMAPREIWPHEAIDFTPWLAENLDRLGQTVGMDLELLDREASVGDFSLDVLARDLNTGHHVIIENQITQTDHDHLGKLLTYAAGFDAASVIWVAESIREEHRQTIEWLNQKTGPETNFFAVTIEVLRIDDSRPAFNLKPVVFPNEWQKERRRAAAQSVSPRGERYHAFFQKLIDELRDVHRFTGARRAQPQSWYAFASGTSGIAYSASFNRSDRASAEIYIDTGDADRNDRIFAALVADRDAAEREMGENLDWQPLEGKQASRIAQIRTGSIMDSDESLEELHTWFVERLLKLKSVFDGRLRALP